jgi:hypothetical protein
MPESGFRLIFWESFGAVRWVIWLVLLVEEKKSSAGHKKGLQIDSVTP